MFSGLFLESCLLKWKGDASFFFWQNCPSPIAELQTKMKSVLSYFFSVSLSSISLLSMHFFSPSFHPPFLLSFSLSSLTLFFHPFSNHCEIARWLVGDFSDREIWLRSESLASIPAFLSQFKWFCSFTGTPTQEGRHNQVYTFVLCTGSLLHLSLPSSVTHTHKDAHTKYSHLKVLMAHTRAAAVRRGVMTGRQINVKVYHYNK